MYVASLSLFPSPKGMVLPSYRMKVAGANLVPAILMVNQIRIGIQVLFRECDCFELIHAANKSMAV